MDIKHVLRCNPLRPAYAGRPSRGSDAPAALGWVDVDGGLVEIGHDGDGFAFDNELPAPPACSCEPFRLADRLVTNGEWLAFIDDGGYRRPELWLSDGWATVQAEGWKAPLYWEPTVDGVWLEHTLHGIRPVDPGDPVCHVSYYEADAYARWAGARLPDRGRVGARRRAARRPSRGNLADTETLPPARGRAGHRRRCARRYGDVLGVDLVAPTCPTPASTRRPARSASTTASSCATRWCCAAAAP